MFVPERDLSGVASPPPPLPAISFSRLTSMVVAGHAFLKNARSRERALDNAIHVECIHRLGRDGWGCGGNGGGEGQTGIRTHNAQRRNSNARDIVPPLPPPPAVYRRSRACLSLSPAVYLLARARICFNEVSHRRDLLSRARGTEYNNKVTLSVPIACARARVCF